MLILARRLVCSLALALPLGCPRAVSHDTPTVLPDPSVSSSAKTALSNVPHDPTVPLDPVDFGPVDVVTMVPKVPAFELGMMDHAQRYGWSFDSRLFGYCQPNGGRGDEQCFFHPAESKSGPVEHFGDWNDKTQEIDPKMSAALVARVSAMKLRATSDRWAFARDLEIAWDTPNGWTLRVGARVRGESASWSLVIADPSPYAKDGSVHPEVVAVSPDGQWLGAIAHTFHGEFSDTFLLKTISTNRAAALAYNDAGHAHHVRKEWSTAADLFRKAVAADSTFATSAYNLACAYARMGDSRAKTALDLAIERAGADAPRMKSNAIVDADFASVKTSAWFVTATAP